MFDAAHNELLDIYNGHYSEFFHLINDVLRVSVHVNRDPLMPDENLFNAHVLILGCPTRAKLSADFITSVEKYVREGGNLLVVSDAGGDLACMTNLNDLLAHFGIEIEPTTVKDTKNMGSSVSPILSEINHGHPVNKNVMRLVVGGSASIDFKDPVVPLFSTASTAVVERYSPGSKDAWKVVKVGLHPLACSLVHGQGKIAVFGDVDIFGDENDYGIRALDNMAMIKNLFSWFLEPAETSTIIDWVMVKLATMDERCNALEKQCQYLHIENERLKKELKQAFLSQRTFHYVDNGSFEDID